MFCVALIYGANYSIAKIVLDDHYIGPLGFILFRVVSAVLLISITHFLFIKQKIQKTDIFLLVCCGLFGVAVNQMFFFMGLKQTMPIHAALIMTMTPLIVLILSCMTHKDQWTIPKIVGVVLGLCGAVLLITQGVLHINITGHLKGDLMILANAVSYGIYLVIIKSLLIKYHPITIMKWVFSFGLVFVFPFGIHQAIQVDWHSFDQNIWLAFGFVLIFTTYFAYLFNAYALSHVSPSVVSIYIYLQPFMASVIAISMGKDTLDMIKITSGALILLGVWLVSSRPQMSAQ